MTSYKNEQLAIVDLLDDQQQCNLAFRRWVDALLARSAHHTYGWTIKGRGVVFTNDRVGTQTTIDNELMLGVDRDLKTGTVKIVQPKVARGAKGPLTVIARDDQGRQLLLREGRLQKNSISSLVKEDFRMLSGLTPARVRVEGELSTRDWYIVADLARISHTAL